jgi:hypothetical protein
MVRPVIGKPLPLGIANLTTGTGNIKVYPNPCTTGQVHISMGESGILQNKENWIITISSMTGQEIYHSQGNDVLDVSGLPSGIYIIKAQNTARLQHLVSKLVIMK